MRRTLLLLATMALTLLGASGVASAATIHCPNNSSGGSPSTELFCFGTFMADTMFGSDLNDSMFGSYGKDTIHGYGGIDYVSGGNGSDNIYGDAGNDDTLGGWAQGGVDRLYGEGGNDTIDASQRHNSFSPVTKEIIDCGGGASDEVYFDKGVDVKTNCEIKHPEI